MKKNTQSILVGVGALIAAYFAYGEYQKYVKKKQIEAAIAGKPGATIQVLESLSTHSGTRGSGVRTVTVTDAVVDPWDQNAIFGEDPVFQ